MTDKQPDALQIAQELEAGAFAPNVLQNERALREIAASALRMLHAELSAIGAGGVEPLRKCLYQIAEPAPLAASAGSEPVAQPTEDVQKKIQSNTWDHFGAILPTLKAISRGDWYWGANSRCKYIEIRLDTRDGGCILYDRERVRISPEQFAHQSHPVRMEPWPAYSGFVNPYPPEGMVAAQALRKVLSVVQRYMPPGGPTAHDAMTEIIEIVDPWPLGPLEKP